MNQFRCIHCCEVLTRDLVALRVRTCGRCAVLLSELGDTVVEPPREPGSDDVRKPRRDGKWLAWAARKRGQFPFFHDYGHAHGFPRDIRQWSPGMVEMAVQAIQAKKTNA